MYSDRSTTLTVPDWVGCRRHRTAATFCPHPHCLASLLPSARCSLPTDIHIYTLHVDIRLYRVHKYYSDKYTILVYDIIIQYTYTINKTNCITELYKQTTIQYSTVLTYIIGRIHICSMLQQQLNNFNLIIIRCKRQCSFSSL